MWTFVAGRDAEAADRLIDSITSQFDHLLTYPEAGRARHDLLVNLRSCQVKSYLIFYQLTDDGIEIFRVLHGSRDIQQAFDEMVEQAE
ncbi:MAG: type II toxin-antitoxin system RelE/ParE family toxin [Pyrinomonadaceae bacterium]